MKYLYEAIEHNRQLPIKIFTQTVQEYPFHCHDDTEFLFVLKGKIEINIDNQMTVLKEGNIFIVNANEFHFIHSADESGKSQLLVLQFDMSYFSKFNLDPNDLLFQITYEKEESPRREAYNRIRGVLASLMKTVINKEEPNSLLIERHLLDLIILLINSFKIDTAVKENSKKEERIVEILKYISNNSDNNDLGLANIAEQFYLNSQYLSRYFKEKIGVSLKKFIDNTRLNRSLQALKSTDETILEIALQFGFPDAKGYYRVFKEVMGITPAQYRDKHKITPSSSIPGDYFSINSKDTLSKLFKYQQVYTNTLLDDKEVYREESVLVNKNKTPFFHDFKKIMTFGYAPHGLREDVLNQLGEMQKDVGFEYIRFHGIFSDELLLYNEKDNGEIYYNFNHIDTLFDSLLRIGLKPFLELGFMPSQLASTDKTIFWWKSNISPPKSMDLWINMIDTFIRHIINRYGIDEVLTWYFEFWNEPELEGVFWDGTINSFYDFFKETYFSIKRVDKRLRVGGFGTLNFIISKEWLRDFAALAKLDGIVLDFFTFHIYQVFFKGSEAENRVSEKNLCSILESNFEYSRASNIGVSLGGPDFVNESIKGLIELADELNFSKDEYFITEWNSNTDSRDLVHDTCFMATFIVKNVLENSEYVKGMGFWTATDIHEEFRLEQPLFHGGFGLITVNGIKKAAYHGFSFLKCLGDELIIKSEDFIVTKRGQDYQILLYNYIHYNDLYSQFDYSQISNTNRYDVFQDAASKRIKILLKGVSGRFQLEQQRVNRRYGSSFDSWVSMGAPKELSKNGLSYLKSASKPNYKTWQVLSNRELPIDTILEPHEIQLITLKRLY